MDGMSGDARRRNDYSLRLACYLIFMRSLNLTKHTAIITVDARVHRQKCDEIMRVIITLWAGSVSVVGKSDRCGQQRQQRRTLHDSVIRGTASDVFTQRRQSSLAILTQSLSV